MNMYILSGVYLIGVATGWLVFERPDIIRRAWANIKERLSQWWFEIREAIRRKWRER